MPFGGQETGACTRARDPDDAIVDFWLRSYRRSRALLLSAITLALGLARTWAVEMESKWSVRVWKTTEGLAGNNVTGLAETLDGFLWVVAGGKLARFDGLQWQPIALDLVSEHDPLIRTLYRAKNGELAFLMHEGAIVRMTGGHSDVFATELPSARPDALAEDEAGALLIAYQNGLVYRLHHGRLVQLTERDGLSRTRARVFFATDRGGQLWYARGSSVGIFRDGQFRPLLQMPDANTRLAPARDGGVWITSRLQLYKYAEGGTLQEIARVPATGGAHSSTLLEDPAGGIWVGTSISGLFRFADGHFENVPISHREVVALTTDREGSLWVGTSGGGINQIQPRSIAIEGEETGLPFRAVQAICEDPNGLLWAVTQDGSVASRVDGSWQNIAPREGPLAAEASCIAADPSGAIWIGTRGNRLYRWHQNRLTSWGVNEGIVSSTIRTLFVDQAGDLWIGGGRPIALQRLRAGKLQSFDVPERGDSIWGIAQDVDGNIWAGGTGSCLVRISPNDTLVDETRRTGALANPIRALHATADGSLWISYDQGGVGRLKGDSFRRITTEHGLIDDNLRLVISDNHGWLWLVGVTSISKVRQEELDAVADGRANRVQPVKYGRDHGLHVVLGGTVGALLSRDGRLWLPLATSLAVIHPDRQQHHSEPPPVLITRVAVDDQVLASHGGAMPPAEGVELHTAAIALDPDHRRLDVDFTALSFRAPDNVRFRYLLENFDDRWIEGGSERRATYSRLVAGDYRFRVSACNSDGVWNHGGAVLEFTVKPFFWDTWWFRGAILAAFTSAVFATTRYVSFRRLRLKLRALEQEAAVERERARIARDIHDDLGGRLTKIVLLSSLVSRDRSAPEKSAERVAEISETARQLMKSLDETVWAVNPRNDTLPHLIDYLGQSAVNFLRTAEITCHLELPENPPAVGVPADVRHNVFLAAKEALTNIVRHAQATEVWLRVKIDASTVAVEISDNGRGFSTPSADPEADGLQNMQQRLTQVGGRFQIESQPSSGTRVVLEFPLERRS